MKFQREGPLDAGDSLNPVKFTGRTARKLRAAGWAWAEKVVRVLRAAGCPVRKFTNENQPAVEKMKDRAKKWCG
jgi:hypothetical protein